MRAGSLALRLFLSAAFWTAAIVVVIGFVLSQQYRETVERAFDRRLNVYVKSIVADVVSPGAPNTEFPQSLSEPLFELQFSGWYWQVTRLDGNAEVRASKSLSDRRLPKLGDLGVPPRLGGAREGYAPGPQNQRLRIVERMIDLGDDGRFLIAVAGEATEVTNDIGSFNRVLLLVFLALAGGLFVATVFQVRFGLAPLKRISEQLVSIRAGKSEHLVGTFPDEIAPLAREVNALIDANREVVERARTHVGNLAHALKTPLSVMVNEADSRAPDPLADKVREQADIMRDQVTRHLERARLAARVSAVGTMTEIAPVVSRLARSMEKIHRGRELAIEVDVPGEARFRGEQQDLEEMVGNLVDNACKWAQGRVAVEVVAERSANPADRQFLRLVVDDDGPGLSPTDREQVAKRGRRLDETKPGSGLGLSIVTELVGLYGGRLTLGTAPIGGLRAELVLPAA
jgi:signal transduction histidine kinase